MTVKDIVAAMPSQFNADAAKGMNSVIQFNLSGEGDNAGQYHAIIKDGAFEVKLKAGSVSKVEISASKVVGKKKMYDTPDSPTYDLTEEIIPAKYNTKTELKHTATGSNQTVDFPLTTK